MVMQQLQKRGITNSKVLAAFREVPRHLFVPSEFEDDAYEDYPLPIGHGQTISQPYIVALMTQALNPDKNGRVLELGTGSGYQAAILSKLAGEVVTYERISVLASESASRLKRYTNVRVVHGDGSDIRTAFDCIIVTAATRNVPQRLLRALKDGGRLVAPVGGIHVQELILVTRKNKTFRSQKLCDCRFVPLLEGLS